MPANPLKSMHEQAEATFLPYGADVHIVESYGEVEAEYAAIRKGTALLDAPHRGVVVLTGKDRVGFLQNKLTNDVARLSVGQGCYAYYLNIKGRILADVNVLIGEDATLLDMDIRLVPDFVRQMEKFIFTEDVKVLDASEQLARLSLMGPQAATVLDRIIGRADSGGSEGSGDAGGIGAIASLADDFRHIRHQVGPSALTIFRHDLTGEPGYELIVPRDRLVQIWQVLQESGNGHDGDNGASLRPIGWSAFNTARIEAGTPLYGIDITEHYLPMETGPWYRRAVSVTKGCYLGQEIVARMHAHNTVSRMLVGLRITGDKLPVAGTEIREGSNQVGIITSSCMSPMLGYAPVALGYVKRAFAAPGKEVEVLAEGEHTRATVAELPLWKKPA